MHMKVAEASANMMRTHFKGNDTLVGRRKNIVTVKRVPAIGGPAAMEKMKEQANAARKTFGTETNNVAATPDNSTPYGHPVKKRDPATGKETQTARA